MGAILYYTFNSRLAMKPCLGMGITNISPIANTEDVSTYKDFSRAWFNVYELKPNYKMDKPYNNYVFALGVKNSAFAFIVKYEFANVKAAAIIGKMK